MSWDQVGDKETGKCRYAQDWEEIWVLFPAVLAKPCRGSLCASVSSFVKKEGNYTIFAHPSESLCLSDDIPCLREYLNESGYH